MGMHTLRHGVLPLITKTRYQAVMGLRSHSEAVSTPPAPDTRIPTDFTLGSSPNGPFQGQHIRLGKGHSELGKGQWLQS